MMCGRFTITLEPADLQEELELGDFPTDFAARYNVAPTQPVAVVRDASSRVVEWMRWGLIPFWAKDPSIGSRMINARSETLLEKPSFLEAFTKRRCLLIADGFYEWQKQAGKAPSIPHFFHLQTSQPFFFAGLWDFWKPQLGEAITSCTIITCAPNELVAPVHDRMPVMLKGKDAWQWLNPGTPGELQGLLKPYTADLMETYPVRPIVNSPLVDSIDLLVKAEN